MDKIKSIFNYEKKDIIERDPGLYRWEKKPYVKDDVKVLNNLLHKMLKKNRSDTCRFKDEKRFFGSSLVKSNYKKKENNQRVMFKMSYSNSMCQHNKYIKYYMPQMQKDNVIDKEKCVGCGACVGACPVEAIKINDEGKAVIDAEKEKGSFSSYEKSS